PQWKRFDSGFDAESKHFGERSEYRVASGVVHELRHRAGTNRPDVRSLISNSVEHRLVAVVNGLVTPYPQRQLTALCARGAAAHPRNERRAAPFGGEGVQGPAPPPRAGAGGPPSPA